MKKNIIYFSTLILLIAISCTPEEKDLFSESSALRLNRTIREAKELFISMEEGWIMEYFPNSSSSGVTFVMDFNEDGTTNIATKSENFGSYTTDKSLFDVIGDNGPVLTFNTYNNVMHYYSDPGSDGTGRGGDYEFIIINTNENPITLKGKKTETKILLREFDYQGNWEEFLDSLYNTDSYLFDSRVDSLTLKVENNLYQIADGYNHIFSLPGEDLTELLIPFIIKLNGIDFYETVFINNQPLKSFKLNPEKNKLISVDNENIQILTPTPAPYFGKSFSKYLAEEENVQGDFLTNFKKMKEEFYAQYNGKRNLVSIGFTQKSEGFTFLINTASNEANFTIPYEIIGENTIRISEFDGNNMNNQDMDTNARLFYSAIPSIKDMLSYLPGTYQISTPESPFNLNTIKMERVNDPASHLILKR